MVQKLEEFSERKRGSSEGQQETEETRTIGRAIARVRSTTQGKKRISEAMVTRLLGSIHVNLKGMDKAKEAKAKVDKKIA